MIILITYSESKTGDFKLLYINEFKNKCKTKQLRKKKKKKIHTWQALLLLRYYLFFNR